MAQAGPEIACEARYVGRLYVREARARGEVGEGGTTFRQFL